MKKRCLIPLLAAVLAACGSNSGDADREPATPAEHIAALEASGELPKLDRSDDLAGPDLNGNGVRDDIEAYIERNYPEPEQKAALMQVARALQKKLLVDTEDMVAVKKNNQETTFAIHCVMSRLQGDRSGASLSSQALDEIEAMTTNTKKRLLAYLSFSKALDGTTWALPEGDTCE